MVLVFGSTGLEGHPKLTSIPMELALETHTFHHSIYCCRLIEIRFQYSVVAQSSHTREGVYVHGCSSH